MTQKIKNFSGYLFLIVGNSGSGKDSIISEVIERYPSNLKQPFLVKRYITRDSSGYEDNYSISEDTFNQMDTEGKFALKWHIYELDYGIPIEIDKWLKKGHPVIANVSRTIIDKARKIYKNCKVIFVKVPFEVTVKRIKDRGREEGKLLKKRMERARTHQTFSKADYVVDNSGDLSDAVSQTLKYIVQTVESSNP
jgi:ribose 1,5-bisphosphokinase